MGRVGAILKGNRFLVMGRAGMDLYATPSGTTIAAGGAFVAALGGSAANIAVGLARQGSPVAQMTCVSDDGVGRFALEQLDRYGVNRSHVRTVAGDVRTTLAVVDTNGDATEAVLYRNGPADLEMAQSDIEAVNWSDHDVLITTGTVLTAEPSRSAALSALASAKAAGLTVILDIDYRAYNWPSQDKARDVFGQAAGAADIVIGNDVEFGVVAGDHSQGLDAARMLASKAKTVVYKQGSDGAILFSDGTETSFGVFRVEALKPTGAGDAFMAGFASALTSGRSLHVAMERGSAAAAIVVTRVGCAPAMPGPGEIDAFLNGRHPLKKD